jgi:hypothetical protein
VRERQNKVSSIPGVLEELTGMASRDNKQAFWAMCQWHVKYRGWSSGRAAHCYKDKFGVWPRGLADTAAPPDTSFEKFVKSRLIAYLKGKGK